MISSLMNTEIIDIKNCEVYKDLIYISQHCSSYILLNYYVSYVKFRYVFDEEIQEQRDVSLFFVDTKEQEQGEAQLQSTGLRDELLHPITNEPIGCN